MEGCGSHSRNCEQYQRASKRKPIPAPMIEQEDFTQPFERVCVDIVGPLLKVKGRNEFLLAYIDVGSMWPKAVLLRTASTETVITALNTIFCRNGYPRVLITDHGSQFMSKTLLVSMILRRLRMLYATIERDYRTHARHTSTLHTKDCAGKKGNWLDMLQLALYFQRMTPNSSTGLSWWHMSANNRSASTRVVGGRSEGDGYLSVGEGECRNRGYKR